MRRIVASLTLALLSLALASAPAAAGCALCVDSVTAHTRDGAAWQKGQPVMLVFGVTRAASAAAFPETGLAVVMEVNKERTKCLDVPLKKVSENGDTASYAGVFYPFYEGRFDGKVAIGEVPQDFRFDVAPTLAPAPVARDAEVPAAPRDAAAPPTFVESARQLLPLTLIALFLLTLPLALRLRRAG